MFLLQSFTGVIRYDNDHPHVAEKLYRRVTRPQGQTNSHALHFRASLNHGQLQHGHALGEMLQSSHVRV